MNEHEKAAKSIGLYNDNSPEMDLLLCTIRRSAPVGERSVEIHLDGELIWEGTISIEHLRTFEVKPLPETVPAQDDYSPALIHANYQAAARSVGSLDLQSFTYPPRWVFPDGSTAWADKRARDVLRYGAKT